MSSSGRYIEWKAGALDVDFFIDFEEHVYIHNIRSPGGPTIRQSIESELDHILPLTQIRLAGEGSIFGTSERLVFSATSSRLQYVKHKEWTESDGTRCIDITTEDPQTGLYVDSQYSVFEGIPILRSTTRVTNKGSKELHLESLASLSIGYLNRGHGKWWDEFDVVIANSNNFREAQWQHFDFAEVGMGDVGDSDFDRPGTRAAVIKSNLGTFSTNGSLPMGALTRKDRKQTFMWQIENSGAWSWELGNIVYGLYMIAGGPTDQHHQWTKTLKPDEEFISVTTALSIVDGDLESSFVPFTRYRRRIRRHHEDNVNLPIIFNDYMNCLKGNPTTEKVTALIEPARKAGSEYFVIDAGWYSDIEGWWSSVGVWEPSKTRFPAGFKPLLDKIRDAGMIPGVWIEPEVIGVNCPEASHLPSDAYFQRRGVRVIEQDRFQLDFRHKDVISRLDAVIDNLVQSYGIGYFKIDYNIDVTHGTDANASSPGDGMLGHRRAYMNWINKIYDRFPHLVLETCSSGAQRLDYHLLASHSIQSTSDQQDPYLYSGISATVLTAVTPEQSASWAYPQPDYNDDLNALCLVNSLMGRVHLSGRIDLLNEKQMGLVVEAMQAYKEIRGHIRNSVPYWPLGLPKWKDDWLVLELRHGKHRYIAVWRRGGGVRIDLPIGQKGLSHYETLFPRKLSTSFSWKPDSKTLSIDIPHAPSARLIHLVSESS
ncbi:alpha-galactosidase [Penicillium herquei]|nr:alpha-galactosidase [Penicillium herquei]